MSRINDALKRLRNNPPPASANPLPPLHRVREEPSPIFESLIPALVIVLIVASFFFIGWACAHHTIHSIARESVGTNAQAITAVPLPVVTHVPPPPPPVIVPELPKLQGIFYFANAPTAILDGKTVKPGDTFNNYRVKIITQYTVTLVDTNGTETKLGMGN